MDGDLRYKFRKGMPTVHWLSIETGATEPGVPDMNGCIAGLEFWVETKKAKGNKVYLAPAQVGWHLRRHRAGGLSFFAVRKEDSLYLYRGADAVSLKELGLKLPPLRL